MTKPQIIRMEIRGIKCDTPGCDYHCEDVDHTNYDEWLDRPCPKCGASLLTQEDLDLTRGILAATDLVNAISRAFLLDEASRQIDSTTTENKEAVRAFRLEMDGTGSLKITPRRPDSTCD